MQRLRHDQPNGAERSYTIGGDKQYQDPQFIAGLRERHVAPHVAEYESSPNNLGKNSLTEAERADQRRSISQRKRKLIERVFGWAKLDRPLRQVKLRGLKRVDSVLPTHHHGLNLVESGELIPSARVAASEAEVLCSREISRCRATNT